MNVRTLAPRFQEWIPHDYQRRALDWLVNRNAAALFLDPGLGKTSVTLAAFETLRQQGRANKMLVVAPLRVCQLVWRQEAERWTQFRHLRCSLLHGSKKREALFADADVYIINPEGIAWLVKELAGRGWPFDIVALDELTKFKNTQAKRWKDLAKMIGRSNYRWGLTGTPAPNGYMDLFGQIRILDDGKRLGRYITHFRDTYFNPGFDGFSYEIRKGAAEKIQTALSDLALRMSAEEYLTLPPLTDNIIKIDLPPPARKTYEQMKKDMIASLPEGEVTAGNAAAVYSKLSQLANGAIYLQDGDRREVLHVHDAKLDALEDLIDELAGQPLLVGFEFQHDLEALQKRFGSRLATFSGTSGAQAAEIEAKWNRGDIAILAAHPASAGHGLNLQRGGASNVAWFSVTWDLELYDQFVKRIFRQGNDAAKIINHILVVENSIDELKLEAIRAKTVTQDGLLKGLASLLHGAVTSPQGRNAASKEGHMTDQSQPVRRLVRPGDAPAAAQPQQANVQPAGWGAPQTAAQPQAAPAQSAPAGWGAPPQAAEPHPATVAGGFAQPQAAAPAGWGAPAAPAQDTTHDLLTTAPADDEEVPGDMSSAPRLFSAGVQAALSGEEVEADPPEQAEEKPKRKTRAKKSDLPAETQYVSEKTAEPDNVAYVGPADNDEAPRARGIADYVNVSITFNGSPNDIRAAMRAFLG